MDEVALRPGTGGVFVVEAQASATDEHAAPAPVVLWDRSRDGGFPEITELKRRVRDVVAPGKPLGHSDAVASSPPATDTPGDTADEQVPAPTAD
ncbi:Selenoprotein W-related protein OS=Cellulomonas persica OX=76861 GN=CPE01_17930 PE=4 SV=1 [Cellulomonas persica]|uniref:Selenoprotein W-related protein n=1 Tax=Cellulomonas persica TaxID=76861 RepID=A0A510UYA3_9CELL|nr:hypothetical protein CPE01_17930 [Cellulomonas persica]